MNLVEKAWVVKTLLLYNAYKSRRDAMESICSQVSGLARTRHVNDATIGSEQVRYGVSWRRDYMGMIIAANVLSFQTFLPLITMAVKLSWDLDEDGVPIPRTQGYGT